MMLVKSLSRFAKFQFTEVNRVRLHSAILCQRPKLFTGHIIRNVLALDKWDLVKKCVLNYVRPALFAFSLFGILKEDEEKRDSELIHVMKLGVFSMQKGELDKAEQLLHIALKIAQELENEQAVTYIFDLLANVAFQKEEFGKADVLFRSVLQRLLQNDTSQDSNAVVEISLKLASIYASLKQYDKAVDGFNFCIKTQEKKISAVSESSIDEDTLLLWAMSLDWYARFLLNIRQYEKAKDNFIKAYRTCYKVNGEFHPQTAVLLNDIGSVCSLQQHYDEALGYLGKAVQVGRTVESEDLASFYVNLGSVYIQKGILSEAEKNCRKGLVEAKRSNNNEAGTEAKFCLDKVKYLKRQKKL